MQRKGGRRAAPSALTPDGVKRLFDGAAVTGGVLVQLLGVYRYLVDPALKEAVGPALAEQMERDAFDLLVSDGRLKMKCLLSPALNELVWRRRISPLDLIFISKFEALESSADQATQPRVCVVHKLSVIEDMAGNAKKKKIVRAVSAPEEASEGLAFISSDHAREVAMVPLAGERRYYLPLTSDHYSLDRACSFAGKRNDWSPSDEMDDGPAAQGCVEWADELEECTSVFTKEFPKVYMLSEVAAAVSAAGDALGRAPLPPMLGTVSVKSKITHLGDPDVPGEFPFAFHIILVDDAAAVEVAFYGSMCAKLYLGLQEGDLLQLRGFKAVVPSELEDANSPFTTPVYYFEHNSPGSVLRVPGKYWKMLQVARVIPAPIPMDQQTESQRPRWTNLSFVSSQSAQLWRHRVTQDRHLLYFDFVGVISFVDKICRRKRKRKLLDEAKAEAPQDQGSPSDAAVTEYRWVKVIDQSSLNELVILIEEGSQPSVFRSLAAGNLFMATKLQWVVKGEGIIQHAATSSLSVLRVQDAILPFLGLEECRLNELFARSINSEAKSAVAKTLSKSWLEGDIIKKYKPTNSLPTDARTFMKVFGIKPLSFSQLRQVSDSMEMFERLHVALIAPIRSVQSRGVAKAQGEANVFLELLDPESLDVHLTTRVVVNPLFQPTKLLDIGDPTQFAESLPLMRVMAPSMLRALYSRAVASAEGGFPPGGSPVGHRMSTESLKLRAIGEWMRTAVEKCFFSLRLFHSSHGHVEWEVDAILPAP